VFLPLSVWSGETLQSPLAGKSAKNFGGRICHRTLAYKFNPSRAIYGMVVDSALKMVCLSRVNLEDDNFTVFETGDQTVLVITMLGPG